MLEAIKIIDMDRMRCEGEYFYGVVDGLKYVSAIIKSNIPTRMKYEHTDEEITQMINVHIKIHLELLDEEIRRRFINLSLNENSEKDNLCADDSQ